MEEWEAALAQFAGAVVAVPHDRRFPAGFTGGRPGLRSGRVVRHPDPAPDPPRDRGFSGVRYPAGERDPPPRLGPDVRR